MSKLKVKEYPYFTSIWLVQIWLIIEMISNAINYSSAMFSFIRYIVFFIATFLLIRSLLRYKTKTNLLTKIFLMWVSWMLISAIPDLLNSSYNYVYFKQFISGIFFMYITIFLIGAKFSVDFYRRLFKFSYQLVILYLIISIPLFTVFIQDLDYGAEAFTAFASAGGILLLTLPYHSNRKQNLIILSSIIAIVLMMILARRNKVLYFGAVLFFSYLINIIFKSTLRRSKKHSTVKSLIILLLSLGLILLMFSSRFSLFWDRVETGTESRDGIIELFKDDFNKTPQDWILGRGIFGEFDGGELATDEDTGLRGGIENGYYETFLKGGGIFLLLLTLVSTNAAYKGLFKSNNILCKGFAALLIVFFISMTAMNQYGLNIRSIIIFIAVASCNSRKLRECTDQYLSEKIGLK